MSSAFSSFNTTTEVPLSKNRTPNCCLGAATIWLPTAPGVCSLLCVCVCVFTVCVCVCVCVCFHGVCVCVCVHLDGLNAEPKFQIWVTILGHTSLFLVDARGGE